MLTLLIIITGLLGLLGYQDFKSKEISWFLIPLLFIGFITKALFKLEIEELISYFSINILIVIVNLLGVMIIISIKEKKIVNIIDNYLGLGDILFFGVLTVVFEPINFVLFYLGSILTTTLIYGVVIFINKDRSTMIPLAGSMSILLMITLFVEHFFYTSFQCYQKISLIAGE